MTAILRDTVAVVRTRPQAIPLAMITMRKSTHGFPFVFHMSMGLRLVALWAARAPLLFMTIATGTVAQNIIYEGLLLMVIISDNDQKVASSKKHNQFKTREQNPLPYL